jgi:hypothetical protein
VEGRDKDRQRGWLRTIPPGGTQRYRYAIQCVSARSQI